MNIQSNLKVMNEPSCGGGLANSVVCVIASTFGTWSGSWVGGKSRKKYIFTKRSQSLFKGHSIEFESYE